jgi:hypothetical protein
VTLAIRLDPFALCWILTIEQEALSLKQISGMKSSICLLNAAAKSWGQIRIQSRKNRFKSKVVSFLNVFSKILNSIRYLVFVTFFLAVRP